MLIIYAHPNKEGHCGYILDSIKAVLEENSQEYEVIDLYELEYDPILKPNEHYSSGQDFITKQNLGFQEKIKEHNEFIVIYPTWWNSTPAILKGFFDRVLTPPFAFKYEGKIPKGMLEGKKAFVFTTTGAPTFYNFFFAKKRSIKTVINEVFKFCGFKTEGAIIDSATKLETKQQEKIRKAVKKCFKFLGD